MNLLEGGNVFKDATGKPLTQRINGADVPGTIKWLEKLTKLDLTGKEKDKNGVPARWLGSTGRRDTSGDLDIALDANIVSKEQLNTFLTQWATKNNLDPAQFVKKAGELHFRTPINGDPKQGFVQTDFNFYPDLKALTWGTFYMGGSSANYKGMARNVLLSSLAKQQGLKIGGNGIVSRTTNKLIANGQDPDLAAQMVLGPGKTRNDLATVETIYANLARDPERDAKLADFREYLAREGLAEPTLKEENEVNFMARLRDRIVNQGMYTLIENKQLTEAKDPRIPYIEDLVLKKGLKGAREAVDIIKQTAENTKQYATIKWDGSPAVIFGRRDDGTFVLTDKSASNAVGYEGLATSPEQIANIMTRRDQTAAANGTKADRVKTLLPVYQELWPYLEAATPKNFRGYFKGDLLYSSMDPVKEEAGNLVFQPNKHGGLLYRIPENSALGQKIKGSKVGLAIHTYMDDPAGIEQSVTDPEDILTKIPGLMITAATVNTLENLTLNKKIIKELSSYVNGENGQALQGLLNPTELRSMQITDLPKLMETFINSLKGTDYSNATPAAFGQWLQTNVTPRKYNNIIEYLQSPRSNLLGMSVAFAIWNKLHELKIDLQRQLDLQQPGQEGWVFSTPAGRAKVVSRTAGGFADPARKATAMT